LRQPCDGGLVAVSELLDLRRALVRQPGMGVAIFGERLDLALPLCPKHHFLLATPR
jgi:hypothetical protein